MGCVVVVGVRLAFKHAYVGVAECGNFVRKLFTSIIRITTSGPFLWRWLKVECVDVIYSVDTAATSKSEECLAGCLICALPGCGGMEVKGKNLKVLASNADCR